MERSRLIYLLLPFLIAACNTTNERLYPVGGAVVGGVVGSQVAGRENRTEGAAIGAVVGALAGHAIAQSTKPSEAASKSGGAGYTNADIDQRLARSLGSAERPHWLPDSDDPARATEALGVVYPTIRGAAGNTYIKAGLFRRTGDGFQLVGRVQDLFGQNPRNARFLSDRIEVTTTMPKPGDPRCCPTGMARWSIDRQSLKARRLR